MTLLIEEEGLNTLRDLLHTCDKSNCGGNQYQRGYGRGTIMGVRTTLVALGYGLGIIDPLIRNLLPKNIEPTCIPHDFAAVYLSKGRFKVHEHFNGFELEDTKSEQRHWLSDGVDCVGAGPDSEEYLSPGTPGFTEIWSDDLNANQEETLQAYFPEVYAKENED
jgi:hypothetical protein